MVDIFRDEHVWAVSDEGCNFIICGQMWLENGREKFNVLGFKGS